MFGSKRKKQAAAAPEAQSAPQPAAPRMSGGYQVTELTTYDGGKRKVVVYTSDSSGKIIKTIKR